MGLLALLVIVAFLVWWANTFFVDPKANPEEVVNERIKEMFEQYDALNKIDGGAA